MAILKLSDVRKWFGGVKAVNGVSLSIEEGSVTGLIGPNGSGKSTLFNVISGVYKPDDGEIYFRDERIDSLPPPEVFKRGIIKSFQIPSLFLNMTVLENSLVPPRDQKGEMVVNSLIPSRWHSQEIELAEMSKELLDFLQLRPVYGHLTKELSGGQMKLTEIGRAVMGRPTLMLLDEPTAGVAPYLAHEILEYIVKLRNLRNMTFFIIEHRLEIFLDYVDYVYVMHLGKVIAEGKPKEIINNPLVQEVYLGG